MATNIMIHVLCLILLVSMLTGVTACSAKKGMEDRILNDQRLYEMATRAMEKKKYETARDYFNQLVSIYPESPHFYEAKLGIADSYYRAGRTAGYYEGIAQYESFVSYYPQHERVCYARTQIANCYFELMEKPDRDQKSTRKAIDEYLRVINLCPESEALVEAQSRIKLCYANLAAHEYAVGFYYFRSRGYGAATFRLKKILRERHFEEFPKMDAVYFYLAESLRRNDNLEESRIYFRQLLEKYPDSRFIRKAEKRLTNLDNSLEAAGG